MSKVELRQEASLFGRYYLKHEPNREVVNLYVRAFSDDSSARSKALIFVRNHPSTLRYVDSGLAIVDPESEVRHRLYVMFAILESNAEYHDLFLMRKRPPLYVIVVAIVGLLAVVRSFVGVVILKAVIR